MNRICETRGKASSPTLADGDKKSEIIGKETGKEYKHTCMNMEISKVGMREK